MKEFIPKDSVLGGINEKALDFIMSWGRVRKISRNSVVFLESEPARSFYIVLKGRVKISRLNRAGNEVVIAILTAGNFFGEMSLLDGLGRSTDALSEESTTLISLREDKFFELLEKFPEIAVEILKEIAHRIRNSDSQIKGLSLLNARGKVASAILRWAKDQGEEDGDTVLIKGIPTQKELASYVGLTRETFNRILMSLKKEGFIQIHHGHILVINNFTEFKKIFGPLF